MKIFIDADACPVVNNTIKIAKKFMVEVILVCDNAHYLDREYAKTITVSKGDDSVDFKIINILNAGDIVITQDYGLAAMCLAKKAYVINQNGMVYDDKNIESLLMSRHIAKKVRMGGGRLRGPAKREKCQDESFEKALEQLILELINNK